MGQKKNEVKRIPKWEGVAAEYYKLYESEPYIWGKVYCLEHFRRDSPKFHYRLLKESQQYEYFACAAPRGSAKSTVLSFLNPAHRIVFKQKHFIIIIQNNYEKAASSLETIKDALREEKVVNDFGITIEKDREGDSIFRHPDGFRTRVICKGMDQLGSIRGVRFGAYRPDLIIIDDLEDDIMVKSRERRTDLKKQFTEVLKFAGDTGTQFTVVGTILHDDSLMADLVSPDKFTMYRKRFYQARTKKGDSIWPEKWTISDLDKMEQDDPIAFAQEMMNDPVSGINTHFTSSDFRYWSITNNKPALKDLEGNISYTYEFRDCVAAIGLDLAWEEKRSADYTAIVPALLTPNDDILLDEYICKKGMKPDEIIPIIFDLDRKYRELTGSPVYFAFEKAKLEKFIKWMLQKEMRKRSHYLILKDIKWDTDKITRIVTHLQPRYANHTIYHRHNYGEYEKQLIRIPSGTHDDLPDAAQGVCQVLKNVKRKKNAVEEDSMFNKLVKQHTAKKQRKVHIFGKPPTAAHVPAKTTLW